MIIYSTYMCRRASNEHAPGPGGGHVRMRYAASP